MRLPKDHWEAKAIDIVEVAHRSMHSLFVAFSLTYKVSPVIHGLKPGRLVIEEPGDWFFENTIALAVSCRFSMRNLTQLKLYQKKGFYLHGKLEKRFSWSVQSL